jgi:hypothetical protein
MLFISGARLHPFDVEGYYKTQDPFRTHSIIKMTLQFERKYSTQGSGAPCHVSLGFFLQILRDKIGRTLDWPSAWIYDSTLGSGATFHMECDSSNRILHMVSFIKTTRVLLKTFKGRTRGRLGTTWEDFKTTQGSAIVPSSLGMLQVFLRTFGL